eukprot:TRINITY_DN105580_c0_g1_i1.p1 TRINITY_DN105580_c0_g1~~TRINITY_DN105580_c0_g1_i1.p1  ORF type:complete len:431 (-),score=67.37 TRINITY_DN105580_c0_g1_i1:10-1302(-)
MASLTALFGTAVGEVGSLFVDSGKSVSTPTPEPLSLVVTAASLQELAEEGLITEQVAKTVWEGLFRQQAKREGVASACLSGANRIAQSRWLDEDLIPSLSASDACRRADFADNGPGAVTDNSKTDTFIRPVCKDNKKKVEQKPEASKTADKEEGAANCTSELNMLFGTSVGEVGALLVSKSDGAPQASNTAAKEGGASCTTELNTSVGEAGALLVSKSESAPLTAAPEQPLRSVQGEACLSAPETGSAASPETGSTVLPQNSGHDTLIKPSRRDGGKIRAVAGDTPQIAGLFGNSVGEIGALLLGESSSNQTTSVSSTGLTLGARDADGEDGQSREPSSQIVRTIVIDTFDDLANFETIAASQGLSEADLQGDMTILDAGGGRFTWDTFTPTAKFPIRMEFSTRISAETTKKPVATKAATARKNGKPKRK